MIRLRGGPRLRDRRRQARAVVWMQLAVTAQTWADQVADSSTTRPFATWPADDPHVRLAAALNLDPDQLAAVLTDVAEQAEHRAMLAGYASLPAEVLA